MRKSFVVAALGSAAILALGGFVLHRSSVEKTRKPGNGATVQEPRILVGTSGNGSKESSTPPPPSTTEQETLSVVPDKDRPLIGTSVNELRELEKLLPAGSRIATYPISESQQKAADTNAYLVDNDHQQKVVTYNTGDPSEDREQLFLGAVGRED